MSSETVTILGWAIILVINLVGWILSAFRSNKAINEAAKVAKETAAKEFNAIHETVKHLPCVTNPEYQQEIGMRKQNLNQLNEFQKEIRDKLDKLLMEKGEKHA